MNPFCHSLTHSYSHSLTLSVAQGCDHLHTSTRPLRLDNFFCISLSFCTFICFYKLSDYNLIIYGQFVLVCIHVCKLLYKMGQRFLAILYHSKIMGKCHNIRRLVCTYSYIDRWMGGRSADSLHYTAPSVCT